MITRFACLLIYCSSLHYNSFTGKKSQPQPYSQTGNFISCSLQILFFCKINMIKRLVCFTDVYNSSFSLYCNSLTGQKSQPQPSQTGNFMSYYLQILFFPSRIILIKGFVCFTAFLLFFFIVIHSSQDRNPNPSLLSLVISCPVLNRFCFFCKISMIKRYCMFY